MGGDVNELRHPVHPMPEYVREVLVAESLVEAYESRPRYQRNDYIGWIERAKHPEVRQERLNQMLEELRRGDVYMHANWRPRQVLLDEASAMLGMKSRPQ